MNKWWIYHEYIMGYISRHATGYSIIQWNTVVFTNAVQMVKKVLNYGIMEQDITHMPMWIPCPLDPKKFWQIKDCLSEYPPCHEPSLSESPPNMCILQPF